jgi:hypothetical protein
MTEALNQISLPVVAGLIALAMAVLAVVRGVMRLMLGMLRLVVGCAVGAWVFFNAPEWLSEVAPNPSSSLLGGLGIAGGVLGHLASGMVLGRLLGGGDAGPGGGPSMSKGRSVVLSLLPTGILLWLGGMALRFTGTLSGLAGLDHGPEAAVRPWLAEARQFLNQGKVGAIFDVFDPVTPPEVVRLCEILVMYRDPARWQSVKGDPALRTVLRHPKFQRLLDDREVKHAVAHSHYARLFTRPEVRAAARDPELAQALRSLPAPEVRRAEPVP